MKRIDKYNDRLHKLKILLTALYNAGYTKIRRNLFIKLVFLIDHYLDRKLSAEPRVFGYNFYVYRHGVFTAKVLADLENIGISYEKDNSRCYIIIKQPFVKKEELSEKDKELYNKFKEMIELYVKPYENSPEELTNYILENLLEIHPGQKVFYYYANVQKLIKKKRV